MQFIRNNHHAVIHHQDAIETLKMLRDECIDLCITDPAYESLEKHRKIGTTTRLKKKWFPIFPNARYVEFLHELYRVMKKNTHVYIFCDEETRDVLRQIFLQGNAPKFTWQKTLVWFKVNRGMGYNHPASYEFVVFLKKGKRGLNTNNYLDVQLHPDPSADDAAIDIVGVKSIRSRGAYPTQKPLELVSMYVTESSNPGDIVLDPFAGSLTTGIAALNNGRHFVGSEIQVDDDLQELWKYRIENGV